MRKLFVAAFAVVSSCVLAQGIPGGQVQFFEQPGSMEFSGRMTVRPLQASTMLAKGMSAGEYEARRSEAIAQISHLMLRYVPETDEFLIDVPLGMNETTLGNKLMASGDFEYVTPDWIVYPIVNPNDAKFAQQWHLPKINAPGAWNYFTGNGSVIVAITDTGIRLDHQDLASQLVPGANSATGTVIPQVDGGQVNDLHGHGTHTAGIAGARGNNSVGVSGVSWNVKIMPIRVSNQSSGSSSISALTAGARWAADNGARVINASYSGVSDPAVGTTGTYIKTVRNGIYCWAAGNDNSPRTVDHVDVTIVGASTQSDTKASFSAYGIALDVFAPGVGILSTYFSSSSSYVTMDGTSMASPAAAGLAALITGTNLSLTAQEVENILYTTCFDLTAAPGGGGNDGYWGWGRIDALAAIQKSYNTKPFAPSSFTVIQGVLAGGGVPQLAISDNQYLSASTALHATGVGVEFAANTTNSSVGRIDVILESAASRTGLTQKLSLFDFTANQWVVVDTRVAPTVDTTITITPANSVRFRQAGTGLMRARAEYTNTFPLGTSRSATIKFDRVGFTTAP